MFKLIKRYKYLKHIIKKIDNLSDRQSVYVGDYKILTSTIYGQRLYLDSRDQSITPHIVITGCWEAQTTKAIQSLVKPGMVVVEIGANLGYYTTLFAAWVGKKGHVYAFEANPDMFDILHSNVDINGGLEFTTLENKAVYDKTGQVNFFVLEKQKGGSSALKSLDKIFESHRDTVQKIVVPAITLDDYWKDKKQKIDLIKIDAEGSEPFIFSGMNNILASHKHLTMVVEFNKSYFQFNHTSPQVFLDSILSRNFVLHRVSDNGNIEPVSRDKVLQSEFEELVFKK